jgi:tetratricopeptide (TPR) repeat protein
MAPQGDPMTSASTRTVRLLGAIAALFFATTPAAASSPGYTLDVHVEPADQTLTVRAAIDVPVALAEKGQLVFTLNESFTIDAITLDAAPAKVRSVARPREVMFRSEYAEYRVKLKAPAGAETVEFALTYSGTMPGENKGGGGIDEHLVELALYRTWFPEFIGASGLTYTMSANLPEGWLATANGPPTAEPEVANGRVVYGFAAAGASLHDINLVASDQWQREIVPAGDWEVELLWTALEDVQAALMALMSVQALELFTDEWGPASDPGRISVAMVPRGGQSYSRLPLMVMNEEWTVRNFRQDPTGCAATGMAHEIAHVWANRGDSSTREDWLNEALAEYGRWRYQDAYCGEERARGDRLASMRKATSSEQAIADVDRAHRDAGSLYYQRGPRLFAMLEDTLGRPAVQRSLATFFLRTTPRGATTSDLVAAFEEAAGYDLQPFLDDWYRGAGAPLVLVESWATEGADVVVAIQASELGATPVPVQVEIRTDRGVVRERVFLDAENTSLRFNIVGTAEAVELNADGRSLVRTWDDLRLTRQWDCIGCMSNPSAERDPSSVTEDDLDRARGHIDDLVLLDPQDDIARYWEARWLFLQRRHAEAVPILQGLLDQEAIDFGKQGMEAMQRAQVLLELGRNLDLLDRREEALAVYGEVQELQEAAWLGEYAVVFSGRPYEWPGAIYPEE